MAGRDNFYKGVLLPFLKAHPNLTFEQIHKAFPEKEKANLKYAIYYLKKTGALMEQKTEAATRELSSIEAGLAIADLIQSLREENKKLKEELEEWKELTEDYDRLKEDNRVLLERVTELSTRISASNSKTIKF